MEPWQALILGLVEGVSEYLPISSTGHLLLAQRILGIPESAAANAYVICIQAGAIAAVVFLYWRRFASIVRGILGRDDAGRRLAFHLALAFMPAAVLALALHDEIEQYLFGLWPVVAAWFVGGIVLLALRSKRRAGPAPAGKGLGEMRTRDALVIGLAQCLAMWPGTSRSLATVLGAVWVGFHLAAAVEFSFLLGVLTLFAATAYSARSSGNVMLATYGWTAILSGFAAALVSAVLSIRWLLAWLERHGLALFGFYRIALALAVAAWIVWGGLEPHGA